MSNNLVVHDPDLDYVRGVARGDAAAARVLVDAYGDRLMAVAYRMLGTRDAAEDIVQEAFIRMWKHACTWQPETAVFSTWLHRVTINLCYDRLRKASTRYEHAAGDDLPDSADTRADGLQSLEEAERAVLLRAALERLPERQKTALVLCHFEEMTNAEAAEIMEVSVQAVESLLARARRGLKGDVVLQTGLSGEADNDTRETDMRAV
ncbi:RNA polymerase sigma factor [Parvularcula sp. IMCC14364]|uniref:RNA polymerase sigma factor n=1 Tax=Parvularcula sp. IMCC14364 TaxID=3067902 RepID=UPI002741385C|nr:RNA polymerase sigma factor [Parvularcula sp. IMCC14364]